MKMLKVLGLQGLAVDKGVNTPGLMGVSSTSTGCSSLSAVGC
jgi:hypothetical protein